MLNKMLLVTGNSQKKRSMVSDFKIVKLESKMESYLIYVKCLSEYN